MTDGVEGCPVAGKLPTTEEPPEASAPQMEQESGQTEGETEQTDEPIVLDKYTAVYDIVAGFRSQVYNSNDDVFKYYRFYQADTQEEFDDFYNNIKELSLYDTGVEAGFGDIFLTLSTCAYHVQDGRFVVVAKRRGSEEMAAKAGGE